jgi:hypothetical protein
MKLKIKKTIFILSLFSVSLLAEEVTYTYAIDTLLLNKKWSLIGGEINNNLLCPQYKITFNNEILQKMLKNPYIIYHAQSYDYNDGCNGGDGKLVYNDYLIINITGVSSLIFCNFLQNDTLKSITKVFENIITNCSYKISNDTLVLQNANGRIYLKNKMSTVNNKKNGG